MKAAAGKNPPGRGAVSVIGWAYQYLGWVLSVKSCAFGSARMEQRNFNRLPSAVVRCSRFLALLFGGLNSRWRLACRQKNFTRNPATFDYDAIGFHFPQRNLVRYSISCSECHRRAVINRQQGNPLTSTAFSDNTDNGDIRGRGYGCLT